MQKTSTLTKGLLAAGGLVIAGTAIKMLTRFKVKNKVILITGGSRGLGLLLARQLADEKAKVIICSRNEEELRKAAEDLSKRTSNILTVPCDITDKQQVEDLIKQIEGKVGPLDVVINNAGIIQAGPMEQMSGEDYESAMKVHFWGPYYTMNAVLESMIKRRKGRIVNIVSIGGKLSFPHLLPYDTSKFALSGFSEGMAAELGRYGVKVTTVYPGLMHTGSPRNIDVKGQHEKEYAWFKTADSLPILSMNAEKAARRIINAMKDGDKSLTLTFPAKLGQAIHGIAPGLTISMFDLVNRFLPKPTNQGNSDVKKGYESESNLSSNIFTQKTEEAAIRNNEK